MNSFHKNDPPVIIKGAYLKNNFYTFSPFMEIFKLYNFMVIPVLRYENFTEIFEKYFKNCPFLEVVFGETIAPKFINFALIVFHLKLLSNRYNKLT